jgi:hypothetical protein
MADETHDKPGLLAKRREKRAERDARTGDTPEKREERPETRYDGAQTAADKAFQVGLGSSGGA